MNTIISFNILNGYVYLDGPSFDLHAVPHLLPDPLPNLLSGELPSLQLVPEIIFLDWADLKIILPNRNKCKTYFE